MKKIFTILSLALSTAAFSQVTVTYQVDITEYIAGGVALDPNGIRVGGNFTTAGASIPDWTPSDPASAMTDLGNGLWSIAVTYPATSVGTTQLYKFVNGNWGTNEGVATSLIAEDGCGTDDGGGNINRTLVIPSAAATYTFCWDKCAACISSIDEVNKVNVVAFPNPASDVVNFQIDATDYVITLTDLAGKTVATSTTSTIEMSGLSSGAYLYKVVTNNGTATGKVTKK
jgi:hypothetical protein